MSASDGLAPSRLGSFLFSKKKTSLSSLPARPNRYQDAPAAVSPPTCYRERKKKNHSMKLAPSSCVCVGPLFDGRTGGIDWVGGGYLFTYLAEKGERKWGSQSNIRRRSRKSFARICSSISKEKSCQSPQRAHLNNEPTLFSS